MNATSDKQSAHVWLLPYQCDPIEYLCRHLVTQYNDQLPDLTNITILIPDPHAASRFRQCLSMEAKKAGCNALIGPEVQSLNQFIEDITIDSSLTTIPKATRELMLVEALREYPHLYGKSSPWLLAEDLLQLFDELSRQQTPLPETLEQFSSALKQAYSIPESESIEIDAQLSQEANLVHTLWQAWQQQLSDEDQIDQNTLNITKLANFIPQSDEQIIFLLGITHFSPAEQQWFNTLALENKATLIIQGRPISSDETYHPDTAIEEILKHNSEHLHIVENDDDDYNKVIDDIYTHHSENILARAHNMASDTACSPLQERLSVLPANNHEQEALGIELQVRQWLHEGKEHIGIVTQDRRLARRLRALFERTNIALRDYSGWALSTTSAAATLERWLECIEQDFNHLPLLDLLKSSFVFTSIERESFLYNIYRFEQDIILHENIASSLYRYQRQVDRRANRINEVWTQTVVDDIKQLLSNIEAAAKPLQELQKGKHTPIVFIDALLASIDSIDMLSSLAADEAGQRVLDEINVMRLSLEGRKISITWSEFRNWLGRTLERYNFAPATNASNVHLLDLNNSLLNRYDALIIAAADTEHLPGRPTAAAFFNDAVRYSLQLQTSEQHSVTMYYKYRCLLHAAPNILFTYTADNDGDSNLASPWLECLQHYQDIAWKKPLEASHLQQWLLQYTGYRSDESTVSISVVNEHPTIVCEQDLLPNKISASSYQQLVNCPYQYFAARCLGLQATDEIRLVLEKSDYGSRIHRCLQAFHSNIDDLPGPFSKIITRDNQNDAIQCLNDISSQLFSHDLEDNFLHRGWLHTWQQLIPLYINWQIAHQSNWQVVETEKQPEDVYLQDIHLNGALDRIDSNDDQLGIIDYKTGKPPSQKDINNGEAVQLPFYALLLGNTVQRVEYLKLSDKVKTEGQLEGDELQALVQAQSERLTTLFTQMQNGDSLPAWGDSKTCGYCDMSGLCRRGAWEVTA